jgi:transcriptional regulator NrdR family protein
MESSSTSTESNFDASSPSEAEEKFVIKRDGTKQSLNLNKLRERFVNTAAGLNMDYVNFDVIVAKLKSGIY